MLKSVAVGALGELRMSFATLSPGTLLKIQSDARRLAKRRRSNKTRLNFDGAIGKEESIVEVDPVSDLRTGMANHLRPGERREVRKDD